MDINPETLKRSLSGVFLPYAEACKPVLKKGEAFVQGLGQAKRGADDIIDTNPGVGTAALFAMNEPLTRDSLFKGLRGLGEDVRDYYTMVSDGVNPDVVPSMAQKGSLKVDPHMLVKVGSAVFGDEFAQQYQQGLLVYHDLCHLPGLAPAAVLGMLYMAKWSICARQVYGSVPNYLFSKGEGIVKKGRDALSERTSTRPQNGPKRGIIRAILGGPK